MEVLKSVDILSVVLVAVSSMAIGFVWYSNALFAKTWQKEVGLKDSDIKGGPGMGYLLTTVASLVMGTVMSIVANYAAVNSLVTGLKLGLLVWVGFTATAMAANYIFAKKSLKLFLIDSGYFLVSYLAAGAIIALRI